MKKEWFRKHLLLVIELLVCIILALSGRLPMTAKTQSEVAKTKSEAKTSKNEAKKRTASAKAVVMRLMKTEGEVGVTNSSGKSISIMSNMKLHNGYLTETQEASYAWINLDSEKLTKLDAVSEAEIRKRGKKLELLLESGNLFFSVTEALDEDESLNVRTSTMAMSIRGTCGWVKSIDKGHSQIYVLEGRVQCKVTDPVDGHEKNITLNAGEMADFFVYSQEKAREKCDIIKRRIRKADIDGFALVEIVGDTALCERIYEASGLDLQGMEEVAQQRLEDSEAETEQCLNEINEKLKKQEKHISKKPVWSKKNEDKDQSDRDTKKGAPDSNINYSVNFGGGYVPDNDTYGWDSGMGGDSHPSVDLGAEINSESNDTPDVEPNNDLDVDPDSDNGEGVTPTPEPDVEPDESGTNDPNDPDFFENVDAEDP